MVGASGGDVVLVVYFGGDCCAAWFLELAGVVVSVEDFVSEFGWDVFFASFPPVVCHLLPLFGYEKIPFC